jgi:enamine deaminase RidA (YjgF/YER057c/UK114 family)
VQVEREIVNPWTWQDRAGFVQANVVREGRRVAYCAGQTSVDADGAPVHEGDMSGQIGQALDNLETVLDQSGMTLADVVRLNYFVTDLDAFAGARRTLGDRLAAGNCRPAATLLCVAALARPEFLIEIEATAVG